MTVFVPRPIELEAVQIAREENGFLYFKEVTSWVLDLVGDGRLDTQHNAILVDDGSGDEIPAGVGDWLVLEHGDIHVKSDQEMKEQYEAKPTGHE